MSVSVEGLHDCCSLSFLGATMAAALAPMTAYVGGICLSL